LQKCLDVRREGGVAVGEKRPVKVRNNQLDHWV
jgi:hypothetical protein